MSLPLARASVHRIACAVVAAELRRLRGRDLPPPHHWPDTATLGDDGLGLDSLEQLGALGALAEAFNLDVTLLDREPARDVGAWIDAIMRQHAAGEGRVTVATSGSTGSPRPCTHAMADLVTEAREVAGRLPGRRRVVAMVPAHHLYGLIWSALLPPVAGIPVVTRAAGAAPDLAPGDLVVAVPDQWRTLTRLVRRFPADIVGISSAGPLDDALAADLLQAGLARLVDVYGSSETGGIALREPPDPAYALLPRWHLCGQEGDWHLVDTRGARHALPDHVERLGERRIRPAGRRDGAVQVGGHNVWPARVAGVLRRIDGVADAAVRLHGSGRLKAFIVPDQDQDPAALADVIERDVSARLSLAERPRSLSFGSALPRNAMGKLEDWP